jgi:hypothetical protein
MSWKQGGVSLLWLSEAVTLLHVVSLLWVCFKQMFLAYQYYILFNIQLRLSQKKAEITDKI